MCKVNIYELKTNLSRYIDLLETGEEKEVVICRYDKQIAKITLLTKEELEKTRVGCGAGIVKDMDFDLKTGFEDFSNLFGY